LCPAGGLPDPGQRGRREVLGRPQRGCSQQRPGRWLEFGYGHLAGQAGNQMLGETPGAEGIKGTQDPPGSIPPDSVRAMVMAGIEALLDHRVLLEASRGCSAFQLLRRQRGIRFNLSRISAA